MVKETDISILERPPASATTPEPQYQDKNDQNRFVQRFSATYVTGSHNFKTGFQLQQGVLRQHTMVNQDVRYIFTRGVPTSHRSAGRRRIPFLANTRAELGIFAQDQWKLQRLTLSLGAAVRLLQRLRAGAADPGDALPPCPFVWRGPRRAELEGSEPAGRRRVRSVR